MAILQEITCNNSSLSSLTVIRSSPAISLNAAEFMYCAGCTGILSSTTGAAAAAGAASELVAPAPAAESDASAPGEGAAAAAPEVSSGSPSPSG